MTWPGRSDWARIRAAVNDGTVEPPRDPTAWPRDGSLRRQILLNMERYLEGDGTVCPIVAPRPEVTGGSRPLPAALAALLPRLERAQSVVGDLSDAVDERSAADLWHVLRSSRRFAGDRGVELTGWSLVERIAVAVAEGLTYAVVPTPADAPPRRGWRAQIEGLDLALTSLWHVFATDRRNVGSLARRALSRRNMRALCRHYTAIVCALFWAAKRATSAWPHCFVLRIDGAHSFHAPFHHSWNWFVRTDDPAIVSFDLTGADWRLDAGLEASLFNTGFDGARWNNASAFLAMLFAGYAASGHVLHRAPEVADALPSLIEPETVRGQALLVHLLRQAGLHPQTRDRLRAFLSRRKVRFGLASQAFATLIGRARAAGVGAFEGELDADHQADLLDRIGVPPAG
jgi:hypothetical protein